MPTSPPDWWAKPKIWLRPRPVPLPTGLVVKNGSNARSSTSAVMPQPVSVTLMRTYSPRPDVADLVGLQGDVGGADAHHAGAVHRVAGVDREVDDGVLELVRIDVGRPGVGGEVDLDLDPLAQRPVEQVGHAGDQLAAVDPLGQQRLGAGERQQPPGQRRGAGRALHGVGEVGHDLALGPVQAAAGEVDAADHHRQHVVEVVGDAAGQLADRFHLLDLAELRLGELPLDRFGAQRLVGVLQLLRALGDRLLERLGARRPRTSACRRAAAFWRSAWIATRPRKIAPSPTIIPSQLR